MRFDLSHINTPAEALLSPWINPFLRLASDVSATQVESRLQVGDDRVDFSMGLNDEGLVMSGVSNGEEFRLSYSDSSVTGELPGGSLVAQVSFAGDRVVDVGQVGTVPFHREIIFDSSGVRVVGEFQGQKLKSSFVDGVWSGTLGDLRFRQEFTRDGNETRATGFIGDDPVDQWLVWA